MRVHEEPFRLGDHGYAARVDELLPQTAYKFAVILTNEVAARAARCVLRSINSWWWWCDACGRAQRDMRLARHRSAIVSCVRSNGRLA